MTVAQLAPALASSVLAPGRELLTPTDLAERIDAVKLADAKEVRLITVALGVR